MSLIRWNPVRDFLPFDREFDNFFRNGFLKRSEDSDDVKNAVWFPSTDIIEEENQFVLKVDLPGVDTDNVKVNVEDGKLQISGKREMESKSDGKNYRRIERSYGSFHRSFTLPRTVKKDEIDAEFKNGQLTITIPKAEEVKPKEIEVKFA